MPIKNKTIVVFSGGMDSTTLLYKCLDEVGGETLKVKAISFDYNQRHKIELEKAKKTCKKLKIEHKIIDISSISEVLGGSALTEDIDVPEGHYEDENMKLTVVPNRNAIFASIAIAFAISSKFDRIALGVHAGDHAIYPDCRPEFIKALKALSAIANYESIEIYAPYLNIDKAEILVDGKKLGVDYLLTHTCYKGTEKPCGKCGSCQERAEAFQKVNLVDPLII